MTGRLAGLTDAEIVLVAFMMSAEANIRPVTTRDVAEALDVTVYQARDYLNDMHERRVVERDEGNQRGRALRWRLIA
ncbi:FaeA/PapI family transcriptional regulator [Escherichia coli]|uniref:FaeA/PapI family transcriptional regulator n=1 Tax=Escherichia coli TaxID=562 RepID=UPI000A1859B1|nr:FaeA/PapI family transcriptional regulator [Escherichia coli]OSL96422.1 hypothetical protein EBAG_04526 [Escherichia coli T426]